MCGICGEFRFDNNPPDIVAVKRMTKKLSRRGPDHEGHFIDGPVAFGHRRLAVIDLTKNANQPMTDELLGLSIVFNGTIYNYKELRTELVALGYRFKSESDTEVILKSYHAWNESCVDRFNGMFAFAIWNFNEKKLFLARDRFGIKPLYYSIDSNKIRFASTIQALLAAGSIDTGIDPIALHFHVVLHAVVPAPRTILKGVKKLATASCMTIDISGNVFERIYWQLDSRRPQNYLSDDQWIEATRETLKKAVKRHCLSTDVPIGVLLSGGLDSSLIVGLLVDEVETLTTFSIGFEDAFNGKEKGDEFEYSNPVAEKFKTRHFRYTIENGEVLKRLPEAIMQLSEPMGSNDVVAFYLLSELVAKKVKVVLCGQGADELFSGYSWYPRMNECTGTFTERFSKFYFDRDHSEYLEMIVPSLQVSDVSTNFVEHELSKPGADTFLDQVWRLDITYLMPDGPVKRVDNMAMAWGVETRVPFLDKDLVELAAKMPPSLKLKEGGKFPLKMIAKGLLPDEIINRPKGYFPLPALKYVTGDYLELMRNVLCSEACIKRGIFRREYVEKLLSNPDSYFTPLNANKLWGLTVLEWWLQLNVDITTEP